MIHTTEIRLETRGNTQVLDITEKVADALRASQMATGIVTLFCAGSTGGLTTLEYEEGVVADLQQVLDEIIPPDRDYRHHQRWGDDNGSAHVRAALLGPSLTIPFMEGALARGTWQHIVFIDFDTRPRTRRIVTQIMGEGALP